MSTPKPLVQAACACEKVLREHDGVLSLIRVVDSYIMEPAPASLPEGFGLALPLTIVVMLKSGDVAAGEHLVGLRLWSPDGTVSPVREWPAMFNGGEHGVNLHIPFALQAPQTGVYWFDVLWGEEVLTRIPLRVRLKTSEALPESSQPTSMPLPSPS